MSSQDSKPTTPTQAVTTTADAARPPASTGAAKAARTSVAPGDMRVGMSFWNTSIFVAGLASDLAKPVADLALPLFIFFLVAVGVCVWLTFFRKPPLAFARTALGASGLGAAVFGFFLGAQLFATPAGLGEERGFLAAVAPPIAAVQTAILPLSETEKQLLTLSSAIAHGEPEVRAAAARGALATTEDANLRRAMSERILRNSDPNVRQAALVQAIEDRGRAPLPILTAPDDVSPLATQIAGSALSFTQFDPGTGTGQGQFRAGGSYRSFTASVANGRLIVNATYHTGSGRWVDGLVIDLSPDQRMQLVGTARSPEGESISIEAPLF